MSSEFKKQEKLTTTCNTLSLIIIIIKLLIFIKEHTASLRGTVLRLRIISVYVIVFDTNYQPVIYGLP